MKAINDRSPQFGNLKVLRVDSSARSEGSISRWVADELIEQLRESEGAVEVRVRDLAVETPSFVDAAWVNANFTPPEQRSQEQRTALTESDALVAELKAADVLVIGVPIYNFGIPAKLKAWVDMVARARLTFRYTENGPLGLLNGKRAYLAVASDGTAVGSEIDFATGYLRHVLGFLGIDDVQIVAADRLMARGEEEAMRDAHAQVDRLIPSAGPLAATA
ncbi:MAG: NAD(P)H-dependent oxidoreductase [Chromatiaceae bacterium]|nr:NAD(P)H-dependent oxidoreductase [Chromatiaceae bacterium]